jgi:N-acetyltransferase 10
VAQALALFTKVMRKISKRLMDIQQAAISATLPLPPSNTSARLDAEVSGKSIDAALHEELEDAGDEVTRAMREKQRDMINSLDISR